MPLGSFVHNVEIKPGKGGQLGRSAGSALQLMAREGKYAQLKMPSGEVRMISVECLATYGLVGNSEHENISIVSRPEADGKNSPHVRGVAMNPVDHPMGGGEGKNFRWWTSVSLLGTPAKSYRQGRRKSFE